MYNLVINNMWIKLIANRLKFNKICSSLKII